MRKRDEETQKRMLRLYETLMASLRSGALPPGAPLASERELSQRYELNRMAVKEVLQRLQTEGAICRIHGRGTFACRYSFSQEELPLFGEPAGDPDDVRITVLGCGSIAPDLLKDPPLHGEKGVWAVERVLSRGEQRPFCYERVYLPGQRPDSSLLRAGGPCTVARWLDACHMIAAHHQKTLRLVQLDGPSAKVLAIDAGSLAYGVEHLVYARDGRVLLLREALYPALGAFWKGMGVMAHFEMAGEDR